MFAASFRASAGVLGPPRDPVIAAWFGGGSLSASGMNVTPDSAMRVTAVYRAVSLLAQTYASLPVGVYRIMSNGGTERDIDHPVDYILSKRPNRWQTSFEWREMMYGHFALRGRCYSEIVSTGGKAVSELIPLHPDHVRPFRAPDGKLAFEYTPSNGPSRVILQDEMHYLHGLTIGEDGITPLSPISAAGRDAIGLAMATQEHSSKLFANGTRLGGLLKMPGHLSDDTRRKDVVKSWNNAFGGVKNTGKTALLEDGMEWQALGMTSEDAQIIETMQFSIADISRIFDGIPLHMLSELSKSTNNNIEHQGIGYVTHTIRPGAIRREEALERDLLFGRSAKTHCIKFDLDGLMRGDSVARAAFNGSMLQNGVFNRNEVRIIEGKNPSTDDGMDKFTVQVNMTTVDKVGVLPEPVAPAAVAPAEPAPPSELSRAMTLLLRSTEQPREPAKVPDIHVHAPITIENRMPPAGDVTVNVPAATAPEVRVQVDNHVPPAAAPDVHVRVDNHVPDQRAADVIVNIPSLMDMRIVSKPKRKTSSEVERDRNGDILSTTQMERDV